MSRIRSVVRSFAGRAAAAAVASTLTCVGVAVAAGPVPAPERAPEVRAAAAHVAAVDRTSVASTRVCRAAYRTGEMTVCTVLFAGRKAIRMPADPSPTERYGAFARGGRFLVHGKRVPLSPELRQRFERPATRSVGYAHFVYLATLTDGTVTALHPVLRVTDRALLTRYFGGRVMEGRIDTRDGESYDHETRVPVRVELAVAARGSYLFGRIVNATRSVRSTDGRCFGSLASLGDADPLQGPYTKMIGLNRQPSMHAPFDDELVLAWATDGPSNMGTAFYPSIARALGTDPLGKVWRTSLHGVPWLGPSVDLRLVGPRGGGRC